MTEKELHEGINAKVDAIIEHVPPEYHEEVALLLAACFKAVLRVNSREATRRLFSTLSEAGYRLYSNYRDAYTTEQGDRASICPDDERCSGC